MNNQDIRWKQRFQNFEKAYNVFVRASDIESPSEAEKMGLIQAFEMVFELAWKILQDYLKDQGYVVKGPKTVFKQAFQDGIVQDGQAWLEALDSRNQTVHMYDESKAEEMTRKIHDQYFAIIRDLYFFFKKEVEDK
ncbi:nucleotidyltransferase substrate binding protein [Thermodesulfovibrionales bacterium]|nr:nucleotidyltransferase substrate binding protein [Thermodesulfovibrionales bacterium]MCL0040891.1 nucleotidyltransferase substrate binding protein [Thermodesulfovibrionales bacterium]MCL0068609.1 nucleotidyltransferase substrate binding protein [Thermodesulfovibrionales bacterium]